MRSINYKHLRYFWVVAKEGSIARASEILHLTPQTISGQLTLLEKSIDVKLLARSGRNLTLTEAGRTAFDYANDIFLLGSELQDVLHNRPEGRPLRFSVGITNVIPKLIAHRLLEPALQLEEPVQLVCYEDTIDKLLADLAIHKLDMVLTDQPLRSNSNVRAFNHHLGECSVTFFGTTKLAQKCKNNFPQGLQNVPMLLPTRETAVRNALNQWFNENKIRPHIAAEFDDSALMKSFGQEGVGVFPAPSAIEEEIIRQYKVEFIGRIDSIREQFYAVSGERKLKHPAVISISEAARRRIFQDRPEKIPEP